MCTFAPSPGPFQKRNKLTRAKRTRKRQEKPNSGSWKARWMSVKGLSRSPRKQTPKPAAGKLRMNPIYTCRSPQMSGSEGGLRLSLRSSVLPSPLPDSASFGNCFTLPGEQGPRTEGHWACEGWGHHAEKKEKFREVCVLNAETPQGSGSQAYLLAGRKLGLFSGHQRYYN